MSDRIAFVFPGQGSQAVGMGKDLVAADPAARVVFETADNALGFSLSDLCFNGPEDSLKQTINTQPAITTASLAALAALRVALGHSGDTVDSLIDGPPFPSFVAGHSVGEYTALIAAGAVDFATGLRLVRERGRLMHHEGTVCPGAMAAIIGLVSSQVMAICAQAESDVAQDPTVEALRQQHAGAGHVVVANDNAPGQIVISGEQTALERAMALASEAGAKRVIPLSVSGAFHSPVMAPAAAALSQTINAAQIRDVHIPLIANITALPITSASSLQSELAAQIAMPVQWSRTIEWMVNSGGITIFVELGAGQVLAGLIKRIVKGVTVLSAGSPEEIAKTAQILRDRGFVA
jgi:[acyl-carrier-protein] S-malonyltransferase